MFISTGKNVLEKGIVQFPSLFIEGAAACGKTTAVRLLLESHPEVDSDVFFMDKEAEDLVSFRVHLSMCESYIKEKVQEKSYWVIFENLNRDVSSEIYKEIVEFMWGLPESVKVFLLSREKPAKELLELLWKNKMGMVFQSSLLFSQKEIEELIVQRGSSLRAEDVYRETGGWPGCVNLILNLAEQIGTEARPAQDVKELCQRYEVRFYIQEEILNTLSIEEKDVMVLADICPWLNEGICEEVLGMPRAVECLKELERKGLLIYKKDLKRWTIAPLFRNKNREPISQNLAKKLGNWYKEHGAIKEALWCFRDAQCEKEYRECVIEKYDTIPFSFLMQTDLPEWKGNIPQLCYLRGMYCYNLQDFSGLRKEITRVLCLEGRLADEVYLNLTFLDPEISLEEWLASLEEIGHKWRPIRLYHFSENTCVFLSGLRELSGLFACTAKEENRRMKLLHEMLGEKEWTGIQLACVDYLLETGRKESVRSEEWETISQIVKQENTKLPWRYQIACLHLLYKIYISDSNDEILMQIHMLEENLHSEEEEECRNYLNAISGLYSLWGSNEDQLARWLIKASAEMHDEVNEENCYILFLQTKGYMLLHQHDKAERILRRLIPYLQKYHRSRFLAELLFQQAIVNWTDGKRGASLRNVIESFLYTGEYRYVSFYASYGKFGKEVLEAYVEWLRNNEPEKWHKKKKYNYGNVLRMPMEDYLGVILRIAKRGVKSYPEIPRENMVEKLTMMETIILQDINKGLTNAEICAELNLKLPTVKTHISNVYKKLNVNTRVQAILKGKELGILK